MSSLTKHNAPRVPLRRVRLLAEVSREAVAPTPCKPLPLRVTPSAVRRVSLRLNSVPIHRVLIQSALDRKERKLVKRPEAREGGSSPIHPNRPVKTASAPSFLEELIDILQPPFAVMMSKVHWPQPLF